jgi:hypothetical protein
MCQNIDLRFPPYPFLLVLFSPFYPFVFVFQLFIAFPLIFLFGLLLTFSLFPFFPVFLYLILSLFFGYCGLHL